MKHAISILLFSLFTISNVYAGLLDKEVKNKAKYLPFNNKVFTGVTCSSNGKYYAGVNNTKKLIVRQVGSGDEVLSISGSRGISQLQFDPTSKFLAVGYYQGALQIWNIEEGNVVTFNNDALYGQINAIEYDANGQRIVLSGGNRGSGVKVFDAQTLEELLYIPEESTTHSSLSIYKDVLAIGKYNGLKLVNINTGELIRVLDDEGSIFNVDFSNDGKFIAFNYSKRQNYYRVLGS